MAIEVRSVIPPLTSLLQWLRHLRCIVFLRLSSTRGDGVNHAFLLWLPLPSLNIRPLLRLEEWVGDKRSVGRVVRWRCLMALMSV